MPLQYRIEFLQDEGESADDAAFVHVRANLPAFRNRIGKESYYNLEAEDKTEFMTGLFNIEGITEASSQAFRIWVMKSPAYNWTEVMTNVLNYLRTQTTSDSLESLPGSAKIDGSGFRLDSSNNRRSP